MKFTTTSTLLSLKSLLALVTADGIFSITGNATTSGLGYLQVLNGNVGDAPTCEGTFQGSPLPTSGTIPCSANYALTYTWSDVSQGIAATYTSPGSLLTYAVPNNGCDAAGDVCQFGFTDLFPSKRAQVFRG